MHRAVVLVLTLQLASNALVKIIDEYGDIEGVITLRAILEVIVGLVLGDNKAVPYVI